MWDTRIESSCYRGVHAEFVCWLTPKSANYCLLYKKIMLDAGEITENNGVLGQPAAVRRKLPKEKGVPFVLGQPRLSSC